MRYLICITILLSSLIFGSCINRNDVVVHEVRSVNMISLSMLEIVAKIENRSCSNIKLRSGVITISLDGQPSLEAALKNVVIIPKRSDSDIFMPLRLHVLNPLSSLSLLNGIGPLASRITVSGSAVATVGLARKKFDFKDMPLNDFLSGFGITDPRVIGF